MEGSCPVSQRPLWRFKVFAEYHTEHRVFFLNRRIIIHHHEYSENYNIHLVDLTEIYRFSTLLEKYPALDLFTSHQPSEQWQPCTPCLLGQGDIDTLESDADIPSKPHPILPCPLENCLRTLHQDSESLSTVLSNSAYDHILFLPMLDPGKCPPNPMLARQNWKRRRWSLSSRDINDIMPCFF